MNKYAFFRWFVPLTILYLLVTWYFLSQGQISYVTGLGYQLFYAGNSDAEYYVTTADQYQDSSSVLLTAKPGQSVEGRIRTINYLDEDVTIEHYPVDAADTYSLDTNLRTLSPRFLTREDEKNYIASWISFQTDEVREIAPRSDVITSFEIDVPSDTTPGLYAAVIYGDRLDDESSINIEGEDEELIEYYEDGVKVNIIYGERIYLLVGDDVEDKVVLTATWEDMQEATQRKALLHGLIIIVNGLLLVVLFVAHLPRPKKRT